MAYAVPEDGRIEPFKGLFLARSSSPMEPVFGVAQPSFCVIAQGSKEMLLGSDHYGAKWEYVRNNPVRHGVCRSAEEWPYQGEIHILHWHDA